MREQWPRVEYQSPSALFDSLHLISPPLFLSGLVILAGTGLGFMWFGVTPLAAAPLPIAGGCMLAATRVIKDDELVSPLASVPAYRPSTYDAAVFTVVLGLMIGTFYAVTPAGAYDVNVSLQQVAIVSIVMFCAVAPVEEVVFRHIIQRNVLWGHWTSRIAVASVLFGSAHARLLLGTPDLIAFGVVIGLGALLGLAYEATGNLTVSIVAHGAYNTFVFAAPLFL